jgi:hypothetical protein
MRHDMVVVWLLAVIQRMPAAITISAALQHADPFLTLLRAFLISQVTDIKQLLVAASAIFLLSRQVLLQLVTGWWTRLVCWDECCSFNIMPFMNMIHLLARFLAFISASSLCAYLWLWRS